MIFKGYSIKKLIENYFIQITLNLFKGIFKNIHELQPEEVHILSTKCKEKFNTLYLIQNKTRIKVKICILFMNA